MSKSPTRMENISLILIRFRWILAAALGIIYIVYELAEHTGNTYSRNLWFYIELITLGIFFPVTMGGVLTFVHRAMVEKAAMLNTFEQQVFFSRKLVGTLAWDELAAVLVRFPHSVLPLTGSAIVTIQPGGEVARLVNDWWRDDSSFLPLLPTFRLGQCGASNPRREETKLVYLAPLMCRVHSYVFPNVKTYCINLIPLTDTAAGVQLFLFCDQNVTLDPLAVEMLYSYMPPVALAVQRALQPDVGDIEASATRLERSRIARRLHDSLAQSIGFLRLKLDALQSENSPNSISEIQQELSVLGEIADLAYEQVRGTLASLQKISDDIDLSTAMLQQARSVGQRSGFEVTMMTTGLEQNISPKVRYQLIYLLQEALINIEKHAKAAEIYITLKWEPETLFVIVKDNGVGFDINASPPDGHYGLSIMQERAAEIDSRLEISSTPNEGTRIELCVPLKK